MAKKSGIYVYPKDCKDFSTTGLVGDLMPIEATFREEKNGVCEVTMKLTYDQLEKWKQCKVGNYIKCLVPVRMPPVVENGQYANEVTVYKE